MTDVTVLFLKCELCKDLANRVHQTRSTRDSKKLELTQGQTELLSENMADNTMSPVFCPSVFSQSARVFGFPLCSPRTKGISDYKCCASLIFPISGRGDPEGHRADRGG